MKTLFLSFILFFHISASERIISLSPSITEIIFGLEKGEMIVATSAYSLYPEKAKSLPIIGGYESPHLEKVLSFRPTLVVGQTHNRSLLKKLKHFNIPTLLLDLKTIQNIKDSIITLGKVLHSQASTKLVNEIDTALQDAGKSKSSHRVMIVYGLREDLSRATYIAGHDIFFEDIIHACGNENAYQEKSTNQPVLSYENIIAINPEQIIILHSLATDKDTQVKRALANWYSLPTKASKNKRISIVDETYLHIPSHRIAQTISRLCREMND